MFCTVVAVIEMAIRCPGRSRFALRSWDVGAWFRAYFSTSATGSLWPNAGVVPCLLPDIGRRGQLLDPEAAGRSSRVRPSESGNYESVGCGEQIASGARLSGFLTATE